MVIGTYTWFNYHWCNNLNSTITFRQSYSVLTRIVCLRAHNLNVFTIYINKAYSGRRNGDITRFNQSVYIAITKSVAADIFNNIVSTKQSEHSTSAHICE